jgi:hypothetical protein
MGIHYIASGMVFITTAIVIGLTMPIATNASAIFAALLLAALCITLGIISVKS